MLQFQPKRSILGWFFSVLLILVMLGVIMLLRPLAEQHFLLFLVSALPVLIFFLIFLFFLIIYPQMRYILDKEALIAQCGPFRFVIPYREIEEIEKTDLVYHPSSTGWKLPGYTLFRIYYADRGYVRMCATRMTRDILLIKTSKGELYGISPRDEEQFLKHLKERLS